MVTFQQIPSNLLVPSFFAEIAAGTEGQGPSIQEYQLLIIGQKTASGTVAELTPTVATSADQVGKYFGRGSMLHGMARALFLNNRFTKATFVALDDAAGSVAASQTVVVAGTATASGTIALYLAGYRVTVAVAVGATATVVRDAIVAAVNAEDSSPISAAAGTGGGDVDLTAKNKGTIGNSLDVRVSFFEGESVPAGLTITIPGFSSGATDPDVSEVWAVLGELQYNVWAVPYTDSSNLTLLNTELEDRWGPMRAIEGVAFLARQDTHANLLTFGDGQKNRWLFSVTGFKSAPSPTYEWAAASAGVAAGSASNDPGLPFQTLALRGIVPPSVSDRFTLEERNLLLADGVATFTVDSSGTARIERAVSTWQEDPQTGAPSIVFRDVQTALTLSYLRYDLRTQFQARYPRHKLADDGTRFGPGQAILTPQLARGEVLSIARGWEQLGLVENLDQFAQDLVVRRNTQDPTRLDLIVPPDLVNQLRVGAARIDFTLQQS